MADITQGFTWDPSLLLNELALHILPVILTCLAITPVVLGALWLVKRLLK